MAEGEEELKSLLMKVKEESEKAGFKNQHSKNEDHRIRSHHFMTNNWETMETVAGLIFLGSKITADVDCSHEIKICLLLGRKAMTNLDSILRSRDITLTTFTFTLTKDPSSQGYGFSSSHVWMCELDHKES